MLPKLADGYQGHLLLYAIAKKPNQFRPVSGLSDQQLMWIDFEDFGIVVSPTLQTQIRAQRAHLKAFNDALASLMGEASVLPFSFGTIASGTEQISGIFKKKSTEISEKLKKIDNAIEMGVSVNITGGTKFAFLVENDVELRQWLEENSNAHADQNFRIEAGRRVEASLNRFNEQLKTQFKQSLGEMLRDVQFQPGKTEATFLDCACLISRQDQANFHQAVQAFSANFKNHRNFNLHITGPWAPFHFSSVS